jgi:uncharacterized protein YjbI with pentapeptide repeats
VPALLVPLRFADLSGADLSGGVFIGADLSGGAFIDANLTGAKKWPKGQLRQAKRAFQNPVL